MRIDLRRPGRRHGSVYTFHPSVKVAGLRSIIYMGRVRVFGPSSTRWRSAWPRTASIVVVPNLYYRAGAFAPFDPKQVFVEGPEQTRFRGMIRRSIRRDHVRDTAAVLDHLDNEPAGARRNEGAVGYCMGGGYAISALGTFPDRVAAGRRFTAPALATDKPDSPHLLANRIRGRLYLGIAEIDPGVHARTTQSPGAGTDGRQRRLHAGSVRRRETRLRRDRSLVYDRAASERHWTALVKLLNDTYGSSRLACRRRAACGRLPPRRSSLKARTCLLFAVMTIATAAPAFAQRGGGPPPATTLARTFRRLRPMPESSNRVAEAMPEDKILIQTHGPATDLRRARDSTSRPPTWGSCRHSAARPRRPMINTKAATKAEILAR
jgi:carboxymethylenebutenolidase